MIRITIEMLPLGDERKKWVMARGIIHNTGQGTSSKGDYGCAISKVSHFRELSGGGWWKEGYITDFPRKKLGVWDLLYRALQVLVGERNS